MMIKIAIKVAKSPTTKRLAKKAAKVALTEGKKAWAERKARETEAARIEADYSDPYADPF